MNISDLAKQPAVRISADDRLRIAQGMFDAWPHSRVKIAALCAAARMVKDGASFDALALAQAVDCPYLTEIINGVVAGSNGMVAGAHTMFFEIEDADTVNTAMPGVFQPVPDDVAQMKRFCADAARHLHHDMPPPIA
jgi:hypothetical protein